MQFFRPYVGLAMLDVHRHCAGHLEGNRLLQELQHHCSKGTSKSEILRLLPAKSKVGRSVRTTETGFCL